MRSAVSLRTALFVAVGVGLILVTAWHGGAFDPPVPDAAGPASLPPSPATLALDAARATGDVDAALPRLDEAIAAHGEWAGLLRHRATLQRERDAEIADAADVLQTLRGLGAGRPEAAEVVALVLELVPPDDDVRAFFATAADDVAGPDARAARLDTRAPPPDAAADLAEAFARAGRGAAALRWRARAFAAAPSRADLAAALARACLAAERPDAAHGVLAAAVAAGADDPSIWRLRAQVAAWSDAPGAEAEALTRFATSHDDLRRLATIRLARGRPDLAAEPAAAAARLSSDHEELVWAADVAARADRIDDAVDLLRESVDTAPDPVVIDLRIATLLLNDLRPHDALSHIAARLAETPDERLRERHESLLAMTGAPRPPAALPNADVAAGPESSPNAALPGLSDAATAFVSLAGAASPIDDATAATALSLARTTRLDAGEWDEVRAALASRVQDVQVRPILGVLLAAHLALPGTRETALWFADTAGTPAETATLAASFAAALPGDPAWLTAWADRASWAGLADEEIRAREALRLVRPHETGNAQRLVELYAAVDRLDDAIAAQRALGGSPEERAILAGLLARKGDDAEAIAELIEMSREMSVEERYALAEHLLGARRIDEALALHQGILEAQPEHTGSLRRAAQLRSWGNDAEGAIPYLDRLIALAPDGESLYLRGEARYATQRDEQGRADFECALPLLRVEAVADAQRKRMLAAILARLGQPDEAARLFEELIAATPTDLHLHLDYAGAMFSTGRYDVAGSVLDRARPLGPMDQRLLRLDGALALEQQRFEHAESALRASLTHHGRDAGVLSDLGRAQHGRGALRGAVESLTESLERQPDNLPVRAFRREIADLLPHPTVETHVLSRTLANDERNRVSVEAATALADERLTLGAVVARDRFVGRALAVRRGRKDARATIESLGLGVTRRTDDAWTAGAGLDLYSGRPDADGSGGWAEITRRTRGPYSSLSLRAHVNEVWDDPTAAAALGGRTHGARLEWYLESPEAWWWFSGRARHRTVTFDHPRRGRVSDPEWLGEVSIGRQILRSGPTVTDRLQPRHAPVASAGTTVAGEPAESRGPRVSAWLSYAGLRVRGGADVVGPLPYSDRFDYVSVTLHATQTVTPGLHADVEVFFGRDLHAGAGVGAVSAALAWRPNETFEVRIGGRRGQDLSRGASGDAATDLELALVLRW